MQVIANGYRGLSLIFQVGGDRLLVPLAIVTSLMVASAVLFRVLNIDPALSPGFF